MNKYFQPYRKRNTNLEDKARAQGGLTRNDACNVYPSSSREITLWIRNNKNNGETSQNRAIVSAYLIELKFNMSYTNSIYTFINKYTGKKFELDYKYYGKLWWIFI